MTQHRSTTSSRRSSRRSSKSKKTFRPDIQGLRALAVVAVIIDHLVHWPGGGFVGVDVFFVISGFLITGILVREADKTGHISFVDFYRRRIKRILPAAALVLVATTVLSFFVFSAPRAIGVAWDGFWALFFSANWNFALKGTDYFAAEGAVSPFQHYWSLSVEEQFYFVWPWLMLLVLIIVRRIGGADFSKFHRAISITMVVIVFVSFAWSLWETSTNPTVAYFSTLSRAWELGIGALLAVFVKTAARIPEALRPWLAWLGIAGILWSYVFIDGVGSFPAPSAAVPVLSTALVIAAGAGGTPKYLFPLTNKVSVYLGDISYSLYLWHFPVIILLAALMPSDSPLYYLTVFIGIALLSVFAYHLVENPVRKSNWLSGKSRSQRSRERKGNPLFGRTERYMLLSMLVAATATVVVVAALPQPSTSLASPYAAVASAGTPDADAPVVSAVSAARTASIKQALAQASWPALTPSLEDFGDSGLKLAAPEWITDGCLAEANARESDPIANAAHCTYGNSDADAAHTAVLYGDSIAISWAQGVRAALGDDWKLVIYTMSGCPASTLTVTTSSGAPYPECDAFRPWVLDQLDQLHPAMVIVSESVVEERLASKATGSAALTELRGGASTTIARVSAATDRVIMVTRPPSTTPIVECYTPRSTPANCVSQVSDDYTNKAKIYSRVAESDPTKITFVDVRNWFCFSGNCPSFVDGITVKADNAHITGTESAALAPLWGEVFVPPPVPTPTATPAATPGAPDAPGATGAPVDTPAATPTAGAAG